MKNIWTILGIEPTTDTRAIKRAYAAAVKGCHQEDESERWQELHEAYQQALALANGQGGKQTPKPRVERKVNESYAPKGKKDMETEPNSKDVYQEAFSQIRERSELQDDELLEWMFKELERLSEMTEQEQKTVWKEFFSEKRMKVFYTTPFFWERLGVIVLEGNYEKNVYKYIGREIFMLRLNLGTEIPYVLKMEIEELLTEITRRADGISYFDMNIVREILQNRGQI